MNLTKLTYGKAPEVRDYLGSNEITTEELTAALINALDRIIALEKQLSEKEKPKRIYMDGVVSTRTAMDGDYPVGSE